MANNNDLLFNAAYAGAIAGMIGGRGLGTIAAGEVTSLVAAAVAFATDVDAGIPTDATISAAGGLVRVPATDDEQCDALSAQGIMLALAQAAWTGRGNPGATIAGGQTALVASVVALFNAAYAARTTP